MAKPIKLTEDIKQKCLEEFQKNLDNARMSLGEFQFKKSLKYDAELFAKMLGIESEV